MNRQLAAWVEECEALCKPDRVVWCDGSDQEYDSLIREMVESGELLTLNPDEYPGCYLHRSNPNDVARTEQLTFICSRRQEDCGPTNNWMAPDDAKAKVRPLFDGCMRGRTMYVVPYVMGPLDSPASKVGVEITDSAYVVANMRIMTRMGKAAIDQLDSEGPDGEFVPGLHSVGDVDPERRFILHFPEERLIWSIGSGYGGNALLGKKCFALRIASAMARDEGWMAEHMLLVELEDPRGGKTYFAGAFPSACGKTNLAMLVSPLEDEGYKVRTVGDDIAWMFIREDDGRLWAVNPEAGYFGVVPGTNEQTNPNAIAASHSNTIYTNVAVSPDGIPWWEGKDKNPPAGLIDWKGNPWTGAEPAAHANSRFTAPAGQNPAISTHWEDAAGVPISGILFGGRRAKTAPLVFEAFNWQHGVFLGATMASRTTAAATGQSNVLRRDPMAMLPFCGYNMGDYFAHWLEMGSRMANPPRIFHVNWFRQDEQGNYLWPGFGDNVRVLIWMLDRIEGRAAAAESPIGLVPTIDSLHTEGLGLDRGSLELLLSVSNEDWRGHLPGIREFFEKFGDKLPPEMWQELQALEQRLG